MHCEFPTCLHYLVSVADQTLAGQKRREKYATLEKQAQSGSSATASSTSPESSSDQGSLDFASCLSSSGVALPDSQNKTMYAGMDTSSMLANVDIDFSMNTFMDPLDLPEGLTSHIDFNTELMPAATGQPYELSHPQAQVSPPLTMSIDHNLDVPILKLLKAGATNATLLGCETMIWDPTAFWVFPHKHILNALSNMQPTPAQLTIPHHPLFDILPWPQLRTKLICIFAMPEQLRPMGARDSMALLQCAYDIEDPLEGFRVNGEGIDPDEWEVGEAFFRNWAWALDRSIIRTSNAWRQKRGQSRLAIRSA